jgi:hypothetical protein
MYSFLSVHASVKRRGERAKAAIKDELNMLLNEKVFVEVKNPTDKHTFKRL